MLKINLKNKKALLFDVDGTLADTMHAHNKSYELAFILNDVPFDIEEHKKWAPYGGEILITKTVVEKGYGALAHQIVKDKARLLDVCLKRYMRPNTELVNFIKQNSKLYTMIAVSNGRLAGISQVLDLLGVSWHLAGIITKENYDFAKPNPQPYLVALSNFNLKPDEVWAFEDNEIGYKSAWDAGIKDIWKVNTNEF
jgi:HAD superfamily hydrolase (TIGR01509 family)